MRRLAVFAAVALLSMSLRAETKIWTGLVDNRWNTPGNWSDGTAPNPGDVLEFSGNVQTNTINDFGEGMTFEAIRALDGPWTFSGNAILLTDGIFAFDATFNLPITIAADQQWIAGCCGQVTFTQEVILNGYSLQLRGQPMLGGQGGHLEITGPIVGVGTISDDSISRFVTLGGDNIYYGPTFSYGLTITSDNGLGIADGTVENGTTITRALNIVGASIGNEAITFVDYGTVSVVGTTSLDGPIYAPNIGTIGVTGGDLTINGAMTGVQFNIGAGPGASLILNNTANSASLFDMSGGGSVVLGVNEALGSNADVRVSGTLDMNDRTASVRSLEMGFNGSSATFAAGSQPLVVARDVELGGTLTLTDSFDGVTGTSYTIIRKDSFGPVVGEFNGLPEGGSFTLRGQTYFITYQGNDGNDVVLHAGVAPIGTLSIGDTSVREDGDTAAITVTLSPVASSTVTVDFTTFNDTATAGSDYEAATGTLTFVAGESQKTILIDIVDDAIAENDETFGVRLTNVAGNAMLGRDEGYATIVDDDAASMTTTYEYARVGNRVLQLDLTVPTEGNGPFPVIVWIHSGQWRGGARTPNPALREVARGYAVAAVDYRLSNEAVFPAQIADVKGAIRWLRAHAEQLHLDPERIGAWGHEAGGHLAALLGTAGFSFNDPAHGNMEFPSRVLSVVEWGGATNFSQLNATALACSSIDHNAATSPESQLLGCALPACIEKAAEASPVTWAGPGDAAFHIVHGARDCAIPPAQALDLFHALDAADRDVTVKIVENVGGPADPYWSSEAALQAVDVFFDAKLKNAQIRERRRAAGK